MARLLREGARASHLVSRVSVHASPQPAQRRARSIIDAISRTSQARAALEIPMRRASRTTSLDTAPRRRRPDRPRISSASDFDQRALDVLADPGALRIVATFTRLLRAVRGIVVVRAQERGALRRAPATADDDRCAAVSGAIARRTPSITDSGQPILIDRMFARARDAADSRPGAAAP